MLFLFNDNVKEHGKMFSGRLQKIEKLLPSRREDILPRGTFTMYNQKKKLSLTGWLPCHDNNICYSIKIGPEQNGVHKIIQILHMAVSKKKPKQIQIKTKLPKYYKRVCEYSRHSMALWTLATTHSYYEMPLCIEDAFLQLVQDFTRICLRGHSLCLKRLAYDPEQCYDVINRGLVQMGELPTARTWKELKTILAWQQKTRWDTACKTAVNINGVQKYKNVWARIDDIQMAKDIGKHFVPSNTNIIQGEPCPSIIPKNAVVLFRSLEDVCKWKCSVDWGHLRIQHKRYPEHTYKQLGILDVQALEPKNKHIYIAYAHLWSVEEWASLINSGIDSYTCIGRLDQYPRGRGQTFRDMCLSEKFNMEFCVHDGAESVIQATLEDIQDIYKQHGVVQCFADRKLDICTGRVKLSNPYRIRTLRPGQTQKKLLYEEKHTEQKNLQNASCISIKSFQGVRPIACVYVCSEETTAFDIHVARTMARDALYIIGEPPTMFAFERRPPKRVSISPFT